VPSVDKLEIKQTTYKEVGSKLEETLERAEVTQHEAAGARKALTIHIKNLLTLVTAADGELEKEIPDAEALKLVKKWLGRAILSTEQFAKHWANVELQLIGEVIGYRNTHDMLQKMVTLSQQQAVNIQAAEEQGTVVTESDGELAALPGAQRPSGVRPMSLKQQRLAEDSQKKPGKRAKRGL